MASQFKIGTSTATLVSLDELTIPILDPKTTFKFYSKSVELGNGMVKGLGWPVAEWNYGFLTQSEREQLRKYCTNASSEVYITTRTRDEDTSSPATLFKTYKAVMLWPENEEYANSRRLDFTVKFIRLEEQEVE